VRIFEFRRRIPGRSAFNIVICWIVISSIVHAALLVFYGLRRFGRKHRTLHGPAIYVANHQSHLDPPILGVLIADRPFTSLARSSLFRNPVFGWLIRQLGAIPLKQGGGDTGAIKQAIEELRAGRRVLIFPEGSRSPDGTMQPFQRGVMLLIKRAKVPVIPLALDGAHDIWPPSRTFPRLSGRLAVMAHPPIDPEELLKDGPDAALEHLRQTIERMRLELRRTMRSYTGGRCPKPGLADKPYWEMPENSESSSDRAEP